MSASAADPKPAAPDASPRKRTVIRGLFLAFLAFQIVVPLSYYLRDDRYDERFAWRMFSDVRMRSCLPHVRETRDGVSTTVQLSQVIHYAWIEHLGRNRRAVIARFLEARCASPGVSAVELVNECRDTDRTALPDVRYARDCASGHVRWPSRGDR
jgi:hypothetical protein